MKRIIAVFISIVCLIVFAGCNDKSSKGSSAKPSSIVGKWAPVGAEGKEKEGGYEFLSDNTGIYRRVMGSGSIEEDSFAWNVLDDGRIKTADMFGSFCMGSLENGKLTFEDGRCWADNKYVYERAK